MAKALLNNKKSTPVGKWSEPVNDRSDFFKPEYGNKYRVHMLSEPYGKRVHFIEGFTYVHSDSKWSDDFKKCVERGDLDASLTKEPAMRYLVPIIVYRTDNKGQVTGPASKAEFTIQVWVMPKTAYQQLYDLYVEFGDDFNGQDLILTVEKKGTMVFVDKITTAAKGALGNDPALAKRIAAEYDADKFNDTDKLDKMLGKTMTLAELEEALENKSNEDRKGAKKSGDVDKQLRK